MKEIVPNIFLVHGDGEDYEFDIIVSSARILKQIDARKYKKSFYCPNHDDFSSFVNNGKLFELLDKNHSCGFIIDQESFHDTIPIIVCYLIHRFDLDVEHALHYIGVSVNPRSKWFIEMKKYHLGHVF